MMGVDITTRHDTACQDLLRSPDLVNGWLRQKAKLHKISDAIDRKLSGNSFQNISTLFSWEKSFVILKEGFVYFYSSETAKKASKVVDLGAYKSTEKAEYVKAKDVAWPFKVVCVHENKDLFLSASSQDDQQHWMTALQKGISEAEAAGRRQTPVIVTPVNSPPPTNARKQSHDNKKPANDSDNASNSDYDEISDCSYRGGGSAEYECQADILEAAKPNNNSRKDRPVPPPPTDANSHSVDGPPKPKPKPPTGAKPPVELKNSKPLGGVNTLLPPLPKIPVKEPKQEDIEVEYEVEDSIYSQALWVGDAEEGVQLMRSIKEDGVFMIRQSTTGNGDQTLQVTVKGELKKYKLMKENGKYRMAGGKTFNDVMELLRFYQANTLPNYESRLQKPFRQASKR